MWCCWWRRGRNEKYDRETRETRKIYRKERPKRKCRQIKGNEVQEGKGKEKKDEIVMEKKEDRRGKRVHIFRIQISGKWRTRSSDKR